MCTMTSAGIISAMRCSTASLMAWTCSKLAARGTLIVTSTKWRLPARRTRTRSVESTPSISPTACVTRSCTPAGAASSNASSVRLPRRLRSRPQAAAATRRPADRHNAARSTPYVRPATRSQCPGSPPACPTRRWRSAARQPPAHRCRIAGPRGRARARADQVDSQRHAQNDDRQQARPHLNLAEEKPLDSLPNDVQRREQQQAGLDERGEIFNFAVAVGVAGIRGPVGDTEPMR